MSYFIEIRHLVLLIIAIVATTTTSSCIWPGKTTYDTPEKPSRFEAGETHRKLVLKKLGNPREQTADRRLTVHDYMRTRRLNAMNIYDVHPFRQDQSKARFLLLVVYDENDIVKRLEKYKCKPHKYKTGDPVCSSRYPLCGVLTEIDDARLAQRYCDTSAIDYYRKMALVESLRKPLRKAVERKDLAMIEQLIAQGADVNRLPSLLLAALSPGYAGYDRNVVKLLLENGADANEKSFWGPPALYIAVKNRDTDLVKMLFAHGANVNAWGNGGMLHLVVSRGDVAMAQLLIAKGANVNAHQRSRRRTPLHIAAVKGRTSIAELLLANGADVHARSQYLRTPLHVAAIKGRTSIAELLLANGADVNAKDSHGKTPLYFATKRGRKETAELLRQHGAKE